MMGDWRDYRPRNNRGKFTVRQAGYHQFQRPVPEPDTRALI
jgi:hypothetical protein